MKHQLTTLFPIAIVDRLHPDAPALRKRGFALTREIQQGQEVRAPEGCAYLPVVKAAKPTYDETTHTTQRLDDTIFNGEVVTGRKKVVAKPVEQIQVEQSSQLAETMAKAFKNLTPAQRARFLPIRAGVRIALEEGDTEAARAVVDGIEAADATEQALKDQFMGLFPT